MVKAQTKIVARVPAGNKEFTIIADSCCSIYERDFQGDKFEFHVAPLTLNVGDKEFIDDENLEPRGLVDAINSYKGCPKSACPSPEQFFKLMEKGDNIIVILLSSKLSGTHASCMVAAAEIRAKFPNKKLFIMDTLSACMGLDLIVRKCRDLIESGLSFDEVVAKLEEARKNTRVRFLLYDLGNLIKNGRLNKMMGKILNTAKIKLVCGDDGAGEIKKYAMALGIRRGMQTLAEFPKKDKAPLDAPILIGHVFNPQDAELVKATMSGFGYKNIQTQVMRGVSCLYAADKGIVIAY